MQTQLSPEYRARADGLEAESILRKCVHCGFCTATCPTYQLLGDELDGPRGRIYLIKQVLEGAEPTRKTQMHLDRCLTCRNCESTCPSGVQYGHLVDIGRKIVDEKVPRPVGEKALRWALKEGLPSPLFAPAMKAGQMVRGLLPELAAKLQGRVNQPDTLYAYHPPCTLQHGQKLRGGVETHLNQLGFKLRTARNDAHLCCGSAGTYSVLNPDLSYQLRDRKLGVLGEAFGNQPPDMILSANIGCITHLQSGTGTPVRHWVEVLDEALLGQ